MSDEEFTDVLARARAGDNGAMARLIAEYEPQLLLVARKRLGPALRALFDSGDLTHSVHRSLLYHLRRNEFEFHSPKDLIALAVHMVQQKVAKKAARMKREREILELKARLLERTNPERAAKVAEELHDLLDTLKDEDRQFLKLYLENRRTVEIARILGQNPGSLSMRRSRLIRKLRAAGLDLE
jgi:RNA polymerase sigma-70 factor (ECF subfamily)